MPIRNAGCSRTSTFRNLSLDDGLIGYWRLDDTAGSLMRDSARSVHDGFIHTSNYGTGTMDPSTTVAPTAFDNPGSNHFDPGGPNSCFVPGGADQRRTAGVGRFARLPTSTVAIRGQGVGSADSIGAGSASTR